jgi:hypothetical protein
LGSPRIDAAILLELPLYHANMMGRIEAFALHALQRYGRVAHGKRAILGERAAASGTSTVL